MTKEEYLAEKQRILYLRKETRDINRQRHREGQDIIPLPPWPIRLTLVGKPFKKPKAAILEGIPIMPEDFEKLREGSVKWTIEQFFKERGYIVYIFWKSDTEALYVGCSSVGLYRPMTNAHEIMKTGAIFEAVSFEYIYCETEQEMKLLEQKLIQFLKPEINRAGKPDGFSAIK